ncbi:diguanylate cyclase domain-containing protein [Vibrio caribbeanicus]|uniref:diguanylate cyclase domain-containing protein n=1 Tax=Vibrio caribbeanicus TaxID=701175 RepID=UPI0022841443|nr:diguanylate cyclase [Vibrio caribbeanicus]MCY9844510.1 diguanylate cyclase [Vibrio caribbeanicus]
MLDSLSNKMLALSTMTLLFVLVVLVAFFQIQSEQESTQVEINYLVDLQLDVDSLKGELWNYKQKGNSLASGKLNEIQDSIAQQLREKDAVLGIQLDDVQVMNESLQRLIKYEKQRYLSGLNNNVVGDRTSFKVSGILYSRYSSIAQSMTEELAAIHKTVVKLHKEKLQSLIFAAAFWLVVFAIIVSAIAWLVLYRFKTDSNAIKEAMIALSRGELDTKVQCEKMDSEFKIMADFFNQMSESLRLSTVTRQELEDEVARQTCQLKHKQEQLLFLAEHDPLTNLLNRRAFDNKLDRAIQDAERKGSKLALLFVDLDDFKIVNDQFGHDAGDHVLVQVARRLEECSEGNDFVARFGGDEFVICTESANEFHHVLLKVENVLSMVARSIEFEKQALKVGASIGVSRFPDQSRCKEDLIVLADEAMYQHKQSKDTRVS